jgi:hypothetical protein
VLRRIPRAPRSLAGVNPTRSPLLLTLGVVLATTVSYPLGLIFGGGVLLPVVNTAAAYVAMAVLLRRGARRQAVGLMLIWAAALAVSATVTFAAWPADPGPLVLNGPQYRDEMLHWIRTGEGREGRPAQFIPQHAVHLAAFAAASLATASAASMVLGAALMNYMGFYVASLARAGAPAGAVLLLGWQPWALCRVAAFVVLGVVLAEPLLSRLRPYPYEGLRAARPWLIAAAAGIAADWALKALLAAHWRGWLAAVVP